MPLRRQVIRRQRVARRGFGKQRICILDTADRAGMFGRSLVGDDLIELARACLGALADHGCGLAADLTRCRLAFAKLTHV
jgi:hypothetical protein